MNLQWKAFIERIKGYWQQLDAKQRRNLILAAVVFLVSVSLLSWFALRPNYVVVFNNLDDSTAGEITAKLDDLKIPYQLQGNTISVPEQYADKARVQLAMNGLPKSGDITYADLFNSGNLGGMTENEFNVKYLAALQGSIANTLKTIDGVNDAKVLIVMPEKKLFVDQNTQDAKASVMLDVKPGVTLSQNQVSGIQQLVAHSVPGLMAQNVTVMDQKGVRLVGVDDTNSPDETLSSAANKQLEIRKQVENDMAERLRNALERMVGVDNVDVVVNADISFDQIKSNETTYGPVVGQDKGIVISEQKSQESDQGTAGPGGVVTNNQNNLKGTTPGTTTTDKSSQTTNYEVNKKQTETVGQPFKVNGYTVAVLVNGQPDTQMEAAIKNYVATATAGPADNGRNPNVTVAWSTYQPPNPFQQQAFYQNPWLIGGAAAGLLLLGGGVYLLIKRRKESQEEPLTPVIQAAEPEVPEIQVETEQQKMRKQIEKLAEQKPDEFVKLLRSWLIEE